jgi:superfamily II DNA or RNA helicase
MLAEALAEPLSIGLRVTASPDTSAEVRALGGRSAASRARLRFVCVCEPIKVANADLTAPRLNLTLTLSPLEGCDERLTPAEGRPLSLVQVVSPRGERSVELLRRDLDAERAALDALARAAGLWAGPREAQAGAPTRYALPLSAALEAVRALHSLSRSEEASPLGVDLRVEWPQGDAWRVTSDLDDSALSLTIKARGGVSTLAGTLDLGGDLGLLRFNELTPLLSDSPGRFLELPSGVFLALTEEFLQRLRELDFAAPNGELSPAAAPVIDRLQAERARVKASKAWLTLVARMSEARDLDPPPPQTLNTTLRAYQVEGFKWMSRLAHWGGGACLADDMGLGKTVQALSVALSRAEGGPCLVVAPTSVCGAWVEEARKFAPSLQVIRFGIGENATAERRRAVLKALGPGVLVVCSYGLLASERDSLCALSWWTVILDEAQSIKTPSSRRHQAAIALKASFKVAMTGTPIENHLRDLWSLMRFLNPGLLGDLRGFNRRFEVNLEASRSALVTRHLRQLVSPFILRRTKRDVLKDLPPKTELTMHVTLTAEEAAHYVAVLNYMRKEVRAHIGAQGGMLPHIFQALSKLRLACCHPSLISPDWQGPTSKFQAFKELVEQLLEGGHKALIFSQFVVHLDILERYLKEIGARYERLDGQVSAEARDRAVARFQAGHADLFLISLKAGGVGLTLTEADYVIHMDPWWNPATEDQATNRAHRIGQGRPVTIYRLITLGTIEERILHLHARKRQIADQVLDGSVGAESVSLEEWLALLDLNSEAELNEERGLSGGVFDEDELNDLSMSEEFGVISDEGEG